MTDILAEGRQKAEAFHRDGDGFKNMGKKNAYQCDQLPRDGFNKAGGCGAFIVTIDRDYGVTPFLVKCGRCGEYARSKIYRVADWLVPSHEWYRPETLEGIDPGHFDHLQNGGLLLRPLPDSRGWMIEGQPSTWPRNMVRRVG